MAKGLDELLGWLVSETAYTGEIGLSANDFIAAVSRFYAGSQEKGIADNAGEEGLQQPPGSAAPPQEGAGETTAPDAAASKAPGSEPDLQLAGKVWGWLIERPEISLGRDGRGNKKGVLLSLDEVLAMPEAKPELRADDDADSQPPPALPAGKRRAAPKKGADLPVEQPGTQPRLYASEQVLWFTLTGHDVDYKRLPLLEWKLLLGIASTREKGILQADLRARVNQDKRSVPKRTDFLAQKGYAVKRTTIARGFRTSMLWLTGFAPIELPDTESSGPGASGDPDGKATGNVTPSSSSTTINLSPEFLAKDLGPVPWCNRWTGDIIEFASFGQTIVAIIKAWGVIRLTDVKQKLGIDGMRWQMKNFAKTCREFCGAGIFRYVAAVRQDERRLFKDCIKFEREPTKEEWDLYLSAGSKRRAAKRDRLERIRKQKERQSTLEPQNEDDYDDEEDEDEADEEEETSPIVPWAPDLPLINLVSESIQKAGPLGVTAPQLSRALMKDVSFYRYFLSLLADMARDNNQPGHLSQYQIVGNTDFLRKNRSTRFKPLHGQPPQQETDGTTAPPAELNCTDGFAPLPDALVNQAECKSLSTLASHAIVDTRRKRRPYNRRKIASRHHLGLILIDGEPGAEPETIDAEPEPQQDPNTAAELEQAEQGITAPGNEEEATIVEDQMAVDDDDGYVLVMQSEDDSHDPADVRRSNPTVVFGKLVPKKKRKGRGRPKRSLVVTFRMEKLKTASFLQDTPKADDNANNLVPDDEPAGLHEQLLQTNGVACRYKDASGLLSLNQPDRTLLFNEAAHEPSITIFVDNIVDAPAIQMAPGEAGEALLFRAKREKARRGKQQKRKFMAGPAYQYTFVLDKGDENRQQAAKLLDSLVQLQTEEAAKEPDEGEADEDGQEETGREPAQDGDSEVVPARGRGRPKFSKASDKQEFVCENCKGSWKNLGGLQYHQTKAKTSCNPNYVPPDRTEIERLEREREMERLERLDRTRQRQEQAAILREEKVKAREEKAKLRQSARAAAAAASKSISRYLEPPSSPVSPSSNQHTSHDMGPSRRLFGSMARNGKGAVPRGLVQNIATTVCDSLLKERPASANPNEVVDTLRAAVTSAISSIGLPHKGAARFVTGRRSAANTNGTASSKRGHDGDADGVGGPPAKRQKPDEIGDGEQFGEQDVDMPEAATADPYGEGVEPAAPYFQLSGQAQQPEQSSTRPFQMPVAQKAKRTTVFALRTQRTSEIIKHIVSESGGFFPSDRSLWYAVYGIYTKSFPNEDPPTLNITKMTIKKLETAKQMEEHTFGFRDGNGRFLYCRILIRPGEDPQSQVARDLKRKIQENYPEPYVPEAFMPTEAGLALLRSVDKDPPEPLQKTRGRRKLSSNIEVLNAPFYDHAASPLFRRAGRFVLNYPENKRPAGRPRKPSTAPVTDHIDGSADDGLGRGGMAAGGQHRNPGLDSLPESFYGRKTHQSGSSYIHFLPPNTSLEEEEGSPDTDGYDGDAIGEPSHEAFEPDEEESPAIEYRFADETVVIQGSPAESGLWPPLLPRFFRSRPEASFTMDGFMPKRKDLIRDNLPRSVADCMDTFRGNRKLHATGGTRIGQFFSDVDCCRDWELSQKGTQLLSNGSVAPDYVFLNLEFPGSHDFVDTPELRWYDSHQYTLDSLPYNTLQDWAENSTSADTSPQKQRVRASRGRGGSLPSRGVGRPRGPLTPSLRANPPHQASYLLNSRRELSAYPKIPSDYLRTLDNAEQAEDDGRQTDSNNNGTVDWTSDNTKIVAFVIVKTLLGGLNQSIDWGLMMRLFPDMKILDLRNFWRWARRERQPYTDKLTDLFQNSFLNAYDRGEVPKIDFDNLLTYDWPALVSWMLQLLERKKYSLPATRAQLELECTLANPSETTSTISSASMRTVTGWREEFFHPTRSVWNRLQDSSLEAAAWPVDAPTPADSARQWHLVARSWLRSLCATPHHRYKPSAVKQRLLTLGGESEPVISRILQGAIVELQAERVLRRTKSLLAMGGRMYRLTEAYTTTLDKLAQEDKFRQARAFKQKLDQCFRGLKQNAESRGATGPAASLTASTTTNPDLFFEVLRTANDDGMAMALINLQAHGRVVLEVIDPPFLPFGFEPGNYETRKFPEHYQRFRQRIVPTERYLFNDDEELAAKLHRSVVASSCPGKDDDGAAELDNPPMPPPDDKATPHGEKPVWRDFFGMLERQRFAKMVGSVVFSLATRGATEAHQTAAHLRPVLEDFEVDLIEKWALSAGILEGRTTGETISSKGSAQGRQTPMPPALSEWWWLQVGEMYGDDWQVQEDALPKSQSKSPSKKQATRKAGKRDKGKMKAAGADVEAEEDEDEDSQAEEDDDDDTGDLPDGDDGGPSTEVPFAPRRHYRMDNWRMICGVD